MCFSMQQTSQESARPARAALGALSRRQARGVLAQSIKDQVADLAAGGE